MLISVVIPAYNCINSLECTLDSILNAGLRDFEILLIEDGSTDGTDALCDALARRHPCVRCIHKENSGVSMARNRGIQEARGRYILFFDADDTVDPGALVSCADILQQNPDMLIFGLSFDYYFHGSMYRREEMVPPMAGLLPREQWLGQMQALYECNALSPVWNKFIRRDLLVEKGIRFPGGMVEMEDFLFSIRCLKHCQGVYFLPEPIYRYRQSEDGGNTYRRLCRIPSLSAYMEPFEAELAAFPGMSDISGIIYESFFYEMIRFADVDRIRQTAQDLRGGKYTARIAESNPRLYKLLEEEKYPLIRLRSLAGRLRHWIAVRVKYMRNGGKMK